MKPKKIVPYIVLILAFILIFIPKMVQNNQKTPIKQPKIEQKQSENTEKVPKIEEKPIEIEKNWLNYRLTSYYPAETSNRTGSGKITSDFTIDEHGWYLYDGKLVLAAATTYLKKSFGTVDGRHYFKYYDEVDVIIDGVEYRGIILDGCGACMYVEYEERIDLFVSNKASVIDRGYKGNNPISVAWE